MPGLADLLAKLRPGQGRVQLQELTTDSEALNRSQANAAQAVRDLQRSLSGLERETDSSLLLGKWQTLTVTDSAIGPVTVSLPVQVPSSQSTRIVNRSAYKVLVRMADASTWAGKQTLELEPGSSVTVTANGKDWS